MWVKYSGENDKQLGQTPSPETHAHDVDLNISLNPQTANVVCHVQATTKAGVRVAPVVVEERAGQIGEISVTVVGGKGAPGRRGEDGAPGRNGMDGRDATRYSAGTDGENGGNGTDGKPGTSGGNGGEGGNVTIRISEADTDILPLLRVANSGGAGGDPGAHGKGGQGGMGGRGGQPCTWTTSHQVPVRKTRQEEYRAYEPHNPVALDGYVTRSDLVYYTDYETQYQQHQQPGGRSGFSGAAGATPTAHLSPGRPGRNGDLAIYVQTTRGVETYRGVFDLTLESFSANSALNNGVYEPGDAIEISGITIKNRGVMPTPDGCRIKIYLRQGDWMVCEPQELYLLNSVAPGERVVIQGTMKFRIKEYAGRGDEAYRDSKVIDLGAATTRFGTNFTGFTQGQGIVVAHPIEVIKVSCPSSLLPGEVAKISFKVRNISNKPIGSDALESELRRAIKLSLDIKSDNHAEGSLVFCDAKGVVQKSAAIERSISSIDRGKTSTVSCHIKLQNSSQSHNLHRLTAKLFLEKIGGAASLKKIQTKYLEIKEGIGYYPQAGDDFLLVTNLTTTPDELRAWGDLAKSLGLSFSTWDVSVHGNLELSEQGPNGSLFDRWKDKSIVLLNQRTGDDNDTGAAPTDLLFLADVDRALRLNNTKVYLTGDVCSVIGWPSISSMQRMQKTEAFSDIDSFLLSIRRGLPAASTLCKIQVGRYTHPFSIPPQKQFDDEVGNLKKLLKERYPNERFSIHPRYSLDTKQKFSFAGVQYHTLGEVTVQRIEIAEDRFIFATAIDDVAAHSARFVMSKINASSLISAMPNKQLAQTIARFLRSKNPSQLALESMTGGVIGKIINESDLAEKNNKAQVFNGIPILDVLVATLETELGANSRPNAESCAFMIAHMEYCSARRLSWKQAFMVFGTPFKLSEIFDSRIAKIEKHLLRVFDKQDAAAYRRSKKDALTSLRSAFGSKSKEEFETFLREGTPAQQVPGASSWALNLYRD